MAKNNIILSKYVNIKNDVAFKKIFTDKQMLLGLINSIIKDQKIVKIEKIQTSDDISERVKTLFSHKQEYVNLINDAKVIMDIVCTTDKDERIIIEMQKAVYNDFHDRSLFYTAIEICDQHNRGDGKYHVCPIYFIGFLDFEITRTEESYINEYVLSNKTTGKEFDHNRLHFIYIELPKFQLHADECKDRLSKIVYSIKNTSKLENMPNSFKNDEYMEKFYNFAEAYNLTPEEQKQYTMNLIEQMDSIAVLNCTKRVAREEGLAEGIEKGIKKGALQANLQTAKNLLLAGISIDIVIQCTGLTEKQVLALQN